MRGKIRDPELIGGCGRELSVDLVIRAGLRWIWDCRALLATRNPLQFLLSHQPFDRAARNILLFSAELMPDLAGPVSAFALVIDTLGVLQILRVLFRAVRGLLRVPGNGYMSVIGGLGHGFLRQF